MSLSVYNIDFTMLAPFIGQGLGFLALFFYVLSGQMKTGKMIMRMNGTAAFIMTIHFFLIGAPVAAAVVFCASMRSLLMSVESARRYRYPVVLGCLAVSAIFGIVTAEAWWMLICIGAPTVWSVAEITGDEKLMRPLGVVSSVFWLANNLIVLSVGGIISQLLIMSSYGLAAWKDIAAARALPAVGGADMPGAQRV